MKKFFAAIVLAVFALVGCDTGSSAGPNDDSAVESSSSSVIASSSVEQSSSSSEKVKFQSSSSEKSGMSSSSASDASSSSEKLWSSSSVETPKSSSSELSESSSSSADEVESSSSSETLATPCKTETEDNCEYGTLLDERDGQEYKTVKIGDQWWMAENLNFDPGQGGSGENKYDWSWCYLNGAENCDVIGRSYTWAAAMDSVKTGCGKGSTCSPTIPVQGICPMGWHLPRTWEWGVLFSTVGIKVASKMLKSQTEWKKGNGADAFGFSALPAGDGSQGGFVGVGYQAHFWNSSEDSNVFAIFTRLSYDDECAHVSNDFKHKGFSVRCVKD